VQGPPLEPGEALPDDVLDVVLEQHDRHGRAPGHAGHRVEEVRDHDVRLDVRNHPRGKAPQSLDAPLRERRGFPRQPRPGEGDGTTRRATERGSHRKHVDGHGGTEGLRQPDGVLAGAVSGDQRDPVTPRQLPQRVKTALPAATRERPEPAHFDPHDPHAFALRAAARPA
jgi:hypothetical protein